MQHSEHKSLTDLVVYLTYLASEGLPIMQFSSKRTVSDDGTVTWHLTVI
jgi:hypothetical protein